MKRERHEVVVELINKYDIETQEELAAYLRKEGLMSRRLPYQGTSGSFVSQRYRQETADRNTLYCKAMTAGWGINISVCCGTDMSP